MSKILLTCLISLLTILPTNTYADTLSKEIAEYVEGASPNGEGRMKFMMWNVYDATLFAPEGKYDADKPFALKLDYLMTLKGDDIAERSIKEIKDQGFDDFEKTVKWEKTLKEIFPDVNEGTTITGIRNEKGHALFFKEGQKIGEIEDQEFTKKFFDIWLGENTSAPKLRKKLLGNS